MARDQRVKRPRRNIRLARRESEVAGRPMIKFRNQDGSWGPAVPADAESMKGRRVDRGDHKPPKLPSASMYSRMIEDKVKLHGYASYLHYMQSPEWKAFKHRVIEAYGEERCQACQFTMVTLHHVTYDRLCEELLSDVIPLCARCHTAIHRQNKRKGIALDDVGKSVAGVFRWTEEEVERRLSRFLELRRQDWS
jgi:hypothetical protein